MWKSGGTTIEMTVGDYGIGLPIKFSGVEIGPNDSIKMRVSQGKTLTVKLQVEFHNIADNTIVLNLTKEQSEALTVGEYVYALDLYRDEAFMCNIVRWATFRVVNKA